MVIGVYRASLTIAGDARIGRAAHRDTFPYCLTFEQMPILRVALRRARSGPIPCLRWRTNGRDLLPYYLTLNIFARPVRKVRRGARNPGFQPAACQKIHRGTIALQQNTTQRSCKAGRKSKSWSQRLCDTAIDGQNCRGSPSRAPMYPEKAHLLPH